jgi:hypothetical protein
MKIVNKVTESKITEVKSTEVSVEFDMPTQKMTRTSLKQRYWEEPQQIERIRSWARNGVSKYQMCEFMDISRTTFDRWLDDVSLPIKNAVNTGHMSLVALAESKLAELVDEKHFGAIRYVIDKYGTPKPLDELEEHLPAYTFQDYAERKGINYDALPIDELEQEYQDIKDYEIEMMFKIDEMDEQLLLEQTRNNLLTGQTGQKRLNCHNRKRAVTHLLDNYVNEK